MSFGSGTSREVPPLVEDLFRRSSARLVATLTRQLGAGGLELARESVQDALVKALQTWPLDGVPRDPEAWLWRVARNRALDRVRRAARWEARLGGDADPVDVGGPTGGAGSVRRVPAAGVGTEAPSADPLDDDELALVFLCCHPRLSKDQAVALTLHTAGGLSAREIAAAFLVPEATVAQRIVRAKRALREVEDAVEVPSPSELPERRDAVLQALYLMFTEGYAATEGDLVVRRELCHEAIRLAEILADHPATAGPVVHAHLALFCLQASRLPARTAPDGGLLLLAEQDRSRWDRSLLRRGMAHLVRAGRGDDLTAVHLEAGIASCHAVAPDAASTDWEAVIRYYELLERVAPSAVVRLNHAVAVAMARGAEAGLALLEPLEEVDADLPGPPGAPGGSGRLRPSVPGLRSSHLLPAVRGWLLARAGRGEAAADAYGEAAARTRSLPVRLRLERAARDARAVTPPAPSPSGPPA